MVRCRYCGAGTRIGSVEPLAADGSNIPLLKRSKYIVPPSLKGKVQHQPKRIRSSAGMWRRFTIIGVICGLVGIGSLYVKNRGTALQWQGSTCMAYDDSNAVIFGSLARGESQYVIALDAQTGQPLWRSRTPHTQAICLSPHGFATYHEEELSVFSPSKDKPIAIINLPKIPTHAGVTSHECASLGTVAGELLALSMDGTPIESCQAARTPIRQRLGVRPCSSDQEFVQVTPKGAFALRENQGKVSLIAKPYDQTPWSRDHIGDCAGSEQRVLAGAVTDDLWIILTNKNSTKDESANLLIQGVHLLSGETRYQEPLKDIREIKSVQFNGSWVVVESSRQIIAVDPSNGIERFRYPGD
jgi:hypothetical protein